MQKRVVYAIQHNKTGRIYIGSSERVEWRIKEHLQALKKHKCKNTLMQSDFDTFGEDYTFRQIDVIHSVREGWKEYYWMAYFCTTDPAYGYNFKDSHVCKRKFEDFKLLNIED